MYVRFLFAVVATLFLTACNGIQPLTVPETQVDTATSSTTQPADASMIDTLPLEEVLPLDPAVRTGTLENGLTYYIRQNTEPENRAELWLAINAGSLQEDEDQLGLAHFLEHMLFNGTERFPQMGVVDFLESIGMEFGPDVNAYTSFDETVYTIQVPTDNAEVLATGLDVLEDWAGAATLDPAEIDKERGVIVEEHRLGDETASGRIQDQLLPAILGESRYSERRPIGDMDVVRSAPPEAFERFYNTWYRPDLMAVIAVGDFDVDDVESMIQERFADLANPANAAERIQYEIPATDETTYEIITDPEETLTEIQIWHRQAEKPLHTGEDYRDLLVRGLYYSVVNERLQDIERQPDAPFLSAWAGEGDYVRPLHVDVSFIQVEDDGVQAGLEATLTELERLARYGVSEGELDRAKQEWLTSYEDALQERNNNESSSHADEYLSYFFSGTAAPGIEYEHALVADALPTITADEVNAVAGNLVSDENRVIIVTAPEKEDVALPTVDALAAVVNAVKVKEIDPFEEEAVASTLLTDIPEPVEILSESHQDELEITEFELANGIRVLVKPTDFMDDEILFTGFSLGGSSLVSDEDYPEASTIVSVVGESGVGDFDQSALEKVLTGKSVWISPYIRELTEGIEGGSSVDDVETLFQLIYLYLTQPRADEDAFEVFKKQAIAALENRALDPNAALSDAVDQALFGDSVRYNDLTIERIESLDLDRGMAIYEERFADMDDAVFIFVGNIDEAQIAALSQRYLGNLPASEREESWQDVMPDPPADIVETNVYKGEGDRSITQVLFVNRYGAELKDDLALDAVESVLDILVREELRENLGGVYASGVGGFGRKLPEPIYTGYVYFGAEPDRVDELVEAAFAQIDLLQTEGPSEENLNKAKSIAISQHEENLAQNGYWRSVIKDAEIYEDQTVADVYQMTELIDSLTAEDVQLAAQQYFDLEQYVKIVLLPESYE